MDSCILCSKSLQSGGKTVIPQQRGRDTINSASAQRGDNIHVTEGQAVHEQCRREYTNKNNISSHIRKKLAETDLTSRLELRSSNQAFDFRSCCLFCGKPAETDGKAVWAVRTLEFKDSIIKSCRSRADEWAEQVKGRLEFVSDLPAADAVYHQKCSTNFRTKRKMPQSFTMEPVSKRANHGRPTDEKRANAFRKVADFLQENDTEQITINDLIMKMDELTDGNAYCFTKMKNELEKHFGEKLIIAEVNGKSNVATFRKTASAILHDFYSSNDSGDENIQKKKIIETAAELIKSDIKKLSVSKKTYPSPDDVASVSANLEFVPESLKFLLQIIFSGKDNDLKIASIGQAIMQAARPRLLIAPLQIGLAIQMHHNFESEFLVNILYSLGYSSSYKEVRTFELSAATTQELKIPTIDDHFVQYMAPQTLIH